MGLARSTLICALWGCVALSKFAFECNGGTAVGSAEVAEDGVVESRGRHRLQLLFPLLLRISTRLATLVPTALMTLLGVFLFVLFSKKAFIVSLFTLFLTLSGKYKGKSDDVYIHKVNSYPDYNGEEHIYYHHREPLKFKKKYHEGNRPHNKWKKYVKRNLPESPHALRPGSLHLDDSTFQAFDHSSEKANLLGGRSEPRRPATPSASFGLRRRPSRDDCRTNA